MTNVETDADIIMGCVIEFGTTDYSNNQILLLIVVSLSGMFINILNTARMSLNYPKQFTTMHMYINIYISTHKVQVLWPFSCEATFYQPTN